jgi:hypothetical protein
VKDQLLTIGLVIALGVGYAVGSLSHPPTIIERSTVPSNYDPARALAGDVIKAAQDQQEKCWAQVVALLAERAKVAGAAH